MVSLLTNAGVGIPVHRTHAAKGEALSIHLPVGTDTTTLEDKLVVLRSKIRVIRIDQEIQMLVVLLLEFRDRHLARPNRLDVRSHRGRDGWITHCKNVFEAGHNAVLARLGKELAAFRDFLDGLVEANRLPLTRPSRAYAL